MKLDSKAFGLHVQIIWFAMVSVVPLGTSDKNTGEIPY